MWSDGRGPEADHEKGFGTPGWLNSPRRRLCLGALDVTDTSRLPAACRAHPSDSTTSSLIYGAELRLVKEALTDLLATWVTSRGATELDVTVITPYTAQRSKLNDFVRSVQAGGAPPPRARANVRVSTVDGCQGASVDCVILSLVPSEPGVQPPTETSTICPANGVSTLRCPGHEATST